MAVNKIIYNGRTLIDISDSTVSESNLLAGAVGYGADGEKVTGTATMDSFFAKADRFTVNLSAANWAASDDGYIQTVNADVSATDNLICQIVLSDDYDTACEELEAEDCLSAVTAYDGYLTVSFSEQPYLDLALELVKIDDLTAATKNAVMCVASKQLAMSLSADAWQASDDVYTQTVDLDITADDIIFGEALLSDDETVAVEEIEQMRYVTQFVQADNNITAVCYFQPPGANLTYLLKIFENKE